MPRFTTDKTDDEPITMEHTQAGDVAVQSNTVPLPEGTSCEPKVRFEVAYWLRGPEMRIAGRDMSIH